MDLLLTRKEVFLLHIIPRVNGKPQENLAVVEACEEQRQSFSINQKFLYQNRKKGRVGKANSKTVNRNLAIVIVSWRTCSTWVMKILWGRSITAMWPKLCTNVWTTHVLMALDRTNRSNSTSLTLFKNLQLQILRRSHSNITVQDNVQNKDLWFISRYYHKIKTKYNNLNMTPFFKIHEIKLK